MSLVRSLAGSAVKPLASSITGAGGGASPLLTNLVAYWNLDESSGNRADSGPNSYTLTDNNTVGSAAGVGSGQTAADFVAANSESLSAANQPGFRIGAASWTAAFWFYSTGSVGYLCACGQSNGASPINGWQLFSNGSAVFFQARNAADTANFTASTSGFSASTWHFVQFGYDAVAEEIFISRNNGTPATATATGGLSTGSTRPFEIGARNSLSHLTMRAQAYGIWNRALTAAESAYLYNTGAAARLYADLGAFSP